MNKASKLKHFVCAVCQQITQLTCKEHENLSDAIVVGEYFGQHYDCIYVNVAIIRNQINDLKVICPRQYQHNGCQQPVEGETTSTNNDKKLTKCALKGELRQHCHLKLLELSGGNTKIKKVKKKKTEWKEDIIFQLKCFQFVNNTKTMVKKNLYLSI
ncbi:hypothetical protein RFI_32797 [Reticulomyxa filosa]|uniref:Uncharacterized protein n=1 Tax=Reticulomyxa filosa TaxID=46433 RepID=X6LSH9_RETFI|nr:hypothetical protein RFI_32797 [Reticulomyxa filosa]|eukprot:ETO04599.1 hypothetical protein RFI_32797 [Reticulomyxa filosa]